MQFTVSLLNAPERDSKSCLLIAFVLLGDHDEPTNRVKIQLQNLQTTFKFKIKHPIKKQNEP